MGYKEIRINTAIGVDNQYINFNLEQEFDNINILSLKLTQSDAYNTFNADYGCIVGRVIANGGVGIPNVRVSVFIPLSQEDELNDDIRAIYPYKTVNDTNIEGYKYNLLPRVSQISPYLSNFTNVNSIGYSPKTPVGTFPTKEEVLTNEVLLEVYKKYYKYSTITNESGDYMIFGVPVGTHTVHMSADITDIGKYSMTPSTMVKLLGVSPDLFDNNGTTIRKSKDLDDLPNVQLQNISVDVRPFWGDTDNFEIGITRQDFKIKTQLNPSSVVFGSMITMGKDGLWGISKSNNCSTSPFITNQCLFYGINNEDTSGYNVETFRLPKPIAEIYTIKNTVSEQNLLSGNFSIQNDIIKLSKTEYVEYVDNGMFVYIIPCNRKKIITNEFGLPEEVSISNPNGVFTEFNGYFLMDSEDLPIEGNSSRAGIEGEKGAFLRLRGKFKIPQDSLTSTDEYLKFNEVNSTSRFIKKNRKFLAGEFYTVSQFYNISYGYDGDKLINSDLTKSKDSTLGIIQVRERTIDTDSGESFDRNSDFPSNSAQNSNDLFFGSQWLNMTLFQIQFAATDRKRTPRTRVARFLLEEHDQSNMYFINDNTQNLGGGRLNSKGFLTAQYHYFDFVNIKRDDIVKMASNETKKIYRANTDNLNSESTYKYATNNSIIKILDSNLGGDIIGRDLTTQSGAFIYKGLFQSDCIKFIKDLNLI
jgi:hypothetical protein